jgi:hypothetical protein
MQPATPSRHAVASRRGRKEKRIGQIEQDDITGRAEGAMLGAVLITKQNKIMLGITRK